MLQNSVTESHDLGGILFSAGIEQALVDGVCCQCHYKTGNTNGNTGHHCTCQTDDGTDIRHYQAHTCAHDDGTHGAVGVSECVGRTLDFGIQRFQRIQFGVLLFCVLGADLLHQELGILICHRFYLFQCCCGCIVPHRDF